MSFDHSSWWYGGDTFDRRTNERLDELAAAQAASRSRLAEQMRKQTGSLQAQIDRLTEAFVAFVEYEDIRGELNQHVDAAAVRRYAREVVATTVMTGGSQLGSLSAPGDVLGYWLAPAARGIALSATGSDAEAQDALAEALRRDPTRAATYLVLLDALRREPRWGTDHVAAVLPQDAAVTRGQRAAWIAAAEGRLGDDARRTLVATLTRLAGSPGPDALVEVLGSPTGNSTEKAVRRLARLREVVTGTPAAARSDDRAAVATMLDAAAKEDAAPTAEDPIADCLRSLVDEGAPSEADVLDRMAAARERMGFVSTTSATGRWDAPAGAVLDLLLGDLAAPGAVGGPLHAVALEVLAPLLRSTADGLEQDAIAAPPPERTLAILRENVTVTEAGATDRAWPERVSAAVRARNPQPAWRRPAAYGGAALAVVAAALAIIVSPGFWVLTTALGVGAGALLWQDVTAAGQVRASVESTVRNANRDIEAASTAIVRDREAAATARASASEHRAAIHQALAAAGVQPADA